MNYKPTTYDHAFDTCLQGEIAANYTDLRNLFGEPLPSDGYKVSTEWVLIGDSGRAVTLYDYKATNLYDSDAPTVEEFRNLPSYDWHVGAGSREDAKQFIKWLRGKLTK